MAVRRLKVADEYDTPLPPPATTLEGRNDQMVEAAFNLVEKRLHDGSASAQETVHFLKMGSTQARLEQEKLKRENLVLETRVKEMEGRRSGEDMMSKALEAFRGYAGLSDPEEFDDPDV